MRCMKYCHLLLTSVLGIVLFMLGSGYAVQAQTKAYVYDQIAVTLDVQSDGLIEVTEELTLAYTGGPFTFARRDIALQRLDAVRDVQVREGERVYTRAQSGNPHDTVSIEWTATHLDLIWYHEPTQDTTRTFTLSYTVDGAVRTGDTTDEIWWIAIFPDREVPVQQSQVTVNLPMGADLDESDVSLPEASGDFQIEDNTLQVLCTTPLDPGQSLDVRVMFAPDLIDAPMPDWQQGIEESATEDHQPSTASDGENCVRPLVFWFIIWLIISSRGNGGSGSGGGGGRSSGGDSGGSRSGGSRSGGESGGGRLAWASRTFLPQRCTASAGGATIG